MVSFREPAEFSIVLNNFYVPENPFIPGHKAYHYYTVDDVVHGTGIELFPLRKEPASSIAILNGTWSNFTSAKKYWKPH